MTPRPVLWRRLRGLAKVLVFVAVLVAINRFFDALFAMLQIDIRPANEETVHRMIMLAAVVYALTLALPFVPGVEVGLALIAIFGTQIVLLVYVCTVVGLCLGFMIGRFIPVHILVGLARDFGLSRLEVLLKRFAEMRSEEVFPFLVKAAPQSWARFLLRHRYIALAFLINMPGNMIIGGGGGIAMIAGLSRCFRPPLFLMTVLIAVSPVPLAVALFGAEILGK